MRYITLIIIAAGLFTLAGCQNKELIECQKNRKDLEAQLETCKEDIKINHKETGKIVEAYVLESVEAKNTINELKTKNLKTSQSLKDVHGKLANAMSKIKSLTTQAKKLQANIVSLKSKIALVTQEAQNAGKALSSSLKKYADANQKCESANNKLVAADKEKAQLKAQIADLEAKLKAAQAQPKPPAAK